LSITLTYEDVSATGSSSLQADHCKIHKYGVFFKQTLICVTEEGLITTFSFRKNYVDSGRGGPISTSIPNSFFVILHTSFVTFSSTTDTNPLSRITLHSQKVVFLVFYLTFTVSIVLQLLI
jgi:hypothetical protein